MRNFVQPPEQVIYTPGTDGTNSLPQTSNNCVTITQPGTVTLHCNIVDSYGCTATTESKTIIVHDLPAKTINASYNGLTSVDLCSNESGVGSTYLWNTGATTRCINVITNGSYHCKVTTAYGCSIESDTVIVSGLTGPLAVHIVSFNGTRNDETNTLSWKLENKQDFVKLDIERSYDGTSFTSIFSTANIDLDNFSEQSYTTSYYRLKITNKDGAITYSSIVVLKAKGTYGFEISIKAYPNPFTDILTAVISSTVKDNYTVRLTSVDGKVVYQKALQAKIGTNDLQINVSNIPSGVYLLSLVSPFETKTIKVFKR